jgi:ankyrin repeat domain-containing protein 50
MSGEDRWGWAEQCSLRELQSFVEQHPDELNAPDAGGATLLHVVAQDAAHPDKLAYLLSPPGVDIDAQHADGTTPLYRAAVAGNIAGVERLLRAGADPVNRNADNEWTVLMVAVSQDHPEIVRRLLAQPEIDVNARDERGRTALHLAAELARTAAAALLVEHPGIDLNPKDARGMTPLADAAFAGQADIVALLLARPGVEVNFVDANRNTPLAWAAQAGNAAVVRLLVDDPRTNVGLTNRPDRLNAGGLARGAGHPDVAELIDRRAASDPGSDELAPGDTFEEPSQEPQRPFYPKPFIPELPGLREKEKP